jgi:hypothetical protein
MNLTLACLKNIELFDYQIQGIKWLLKKETGENTAPFYKSVKEGGKNMYLCEITQSSQSQPPSPIKGSILCDVSYTCSLKLHLPCVRVRGPLICACIDFYKFFNRKWVLGKQYRR